VPGSDEEKFTALYRQHHRQVHAYAVTRAGRQLAEEVVAEAFLVAWRRLKSIPEKAPLPWLLAVARNVTRERFRQDARRQAVTAEMQVWLDEADLTAADVADGVTERATVLAALAKLSEEDRELLTLIAWHGLTPAQAAKVLGCTTAAYFVRLHRARRRLQAAAAEPSKPRLKESIR
jgi:RNA polymerase sigma-70 factor (ECF subfamily)